MALSNNAGVIKFGANGAERLRIRGDGIVKVAIENYLRLEGRTGKALSIGGSGLVEADAPSGVGGRFSIDNSGNVKCKGALTFAGKLKNTYWKFTNDSDYCRLNAINGGYFNFAAQKLYACTSLEVTTTANIGGT